MMRTNSLISTDSCWFNIELNRIWINSVFIPMERHDQISEQGQNIREFFPPRIPSCQTFSAHVGVTKDASVERCFQFHGKKETFSFSY